ncbi:putative C-S lyase [Acidithiobacillus ferrooxidans F221]|uniref:PatB family C-S lyase n=1 Tax=Acidithiobacillus ferrooxidans TaxID=920 RepID=UPI001C07276F|nr:PatB family C-S lyase [Acidithiobacillus ferrooxidans]MBU2809560.1 putative C-S lyase [Acidithiobacillus ferrooxidans F221]
MSAEQDSVDFDRIIPRRGTGSLKWDGAAEHFGAEVLPMWVADMDFAAPDAAIAALQERLNHPVFGYPGNEGTMLQAAADWLARRHDWRPENDAIACISGVVPALYAAVRAFTRPGEAIIVMPPIYPPFMTAVEDNGRKLLLAPLIPDDTGHYRMNWDALEIAVQRAKLLLLCSPHNPVGRVWTAEELQRLGTLCADADCVVVSDEIHADLSQHPHCPFPSRFPRSILLTSAGKSFNLAGLGGGVSVIPDAGLRRTFLAEVRRSQIQHTNLFALTAMTGAWRRSAEWQSALRQYLSNNARFISEYLMRELPEVGYRQPEFGYLAWLDVHHYGNDESLARHLLQAGLGLNPGPSFGPGGEGFLRLNFATPRSMLEEGLGRLRQALHP